MTTSNAELEQRILSNPDDLSAYLVYGDWLTERGDPRGELIAVQAKLKETPDDDALKATEAKLLADNASAWLGDLAGKKDKDLHIAWRLGFIDSIRLGPPLDDYGASELDFPAALATLMRLPGTLFVREIIVGSKEHDDYPTSWQDSIDALAEHGVPEGLTRLEFNRGGFWDISSTELGSLVSLYPRLSKLRELSIEMGAMDFGKIDLPALRSLVIVTGGLTSANLESIGSASWPNLERLSICIGETDNEYGCNVQFADIQKFLQSPNLRRVKHLGIRNTNHADRVVAELAQSKLLSQLETLDFSSGTFSDEGARVILDNAKSFAHLKQIDLTHHYVSRAVGEELSKVGPKIILDEAEAPDGEDDEDDRYVGISE